MTYSLIRSFGKNNCLSLFLCFSLFSNSFLLGTDATRTESPTVVEIDTEAADHRHNPAEAAALNELYAKYNEQLNMLALTVQNISQLILTKKITPANPYGAYEWLQQMSAVINKAAKLPYAPLTSKKLVHFFNFNKTLVKTIASAYKENLDVRAGAESLATALDTLEATVQVESSTRVPLQVAANYATESGQMVDALSNTISGSGLSWYNHVYRKVTSINRNFHITSTAVTVASMAALTHAVIMLTPSRYFYGSDDGGKTINKYLVNKRLADYKHDVAGSFNPQNDDVMRFRDVATAFGLGVSGIQGLNSWFGLSDGMAKLWNDFDAFLKGSTPDNSKQFIKYVDDLTLDDPMFDCVRDKFGPFNTILKFLERPDLHINTKTDIPKCVLLTGTPGSGKTHSARALAGSINKLFAELGHFEKCGFIEVEPWSLPEIDDIIKQAQANAPCVIFIDEFHLFGGGAQINSNAMWLSKLLTEIDKIDKSKDPTQQIFVLAATNRPDLLADALLRHGRFGIDARVEFPRPSHDQRKSVFNALCRKSAVDTTDIDLDKLAQLTQGQSFSAINKIFERAGFLAKQQAEGINYDYLYQALNQVVRGLGKKVHLNDYEKDVIATHLAGIALAHLRMETTTHLESITIQAPACSVTERLDFLAKMENQDSDAQHAANHGAFYTYQEHEHIRPAAVTAADISCKLLLAGRVAQSTILDIKSSYGKVDKQLAFEDALSMLLDGYKIEDLSKAEKEYYRHEAHKLVAQCEHELKEFFTQNRATVQAIAEALKEKEFLTADEIKTIIVEASENQ